MKMREAIKKDTIEKGEENRNGLLFIPTVFFDMVEVYKILF